MPSFRFLLIAIVSLVLAGGAAAQGPDLAAPMRSLAQAERELQTVDRALDGRADADAEKELRARATAAAVVSEDAVRLLQVQLAMVQARLAGLGPVTPGTPEAPEIRRQRAELTGEASIIDSAIKRGRLAGVEAGQLVAEIDRSRVEQFGETITARVASPLSPGYWRALVASVPRDLRRIGQFATQGAAEVRRNWPGSVPWEAVLGTLLALAILFPGRALARRLGQRYLIDDAPGHRLRRSANALWRVVIGTLAPILALVALGQGLRWADLLPERWAGVFDLLIGAFGYAGFSAAILGAVLVRDQPSWRIAPIDDDTARRLRPLSGLLAGLSGVSIFVTGFTAIVGASHATVIATQATEALLHLALIGAFLLVIARLRAHRADAEDDVSRSASAGLGIVALLLWVLVGAGLIALLVGYIGLALFIAQFIAWATVLGAALYLTMAASDDIATTIFSRRSQLGLALTRAFGLRGAVVEQFGLLLSGVLRIGLVILALGLLLTPFGTGGGLGTIFGRLGALAQGIQLGGIAISPMTILRGLIVLAVGLALVRAFMGWLEHRYLPATDLDGSGRNSVSLVARYVGIALAIIWALASLGIGVERIALLLSALSVGIGFGLQAITQNFVSGLILLAERPIKIGDLIRVGAEEGDVKRISVRSTEIELADHSTLIVPNSELITKSVLNKTLAGNLGRIQIQFSVPLDTDADLVRRIVLAAIAAEPAVLDEPAADVFVDSIVEGRILFNCFAHAASPRAVYRARSNILMQVLSDFRAQGIGIGTVPAPLETPAAASPPAR